MMGLKRRSDIHWSRKLWHMGGVSVMALIYAYAPLWVALGILAVTWIIFVPFDILRQRRPRLNEWLMRFFNPIMREHEENRLAGTTYLLTGVAIVGLLFPREVVLPTLLFLAFADPFASVVGIKYGRNKIFGHKSIQGTAAAYLVCFVLSYSFFANHGILPGRQLVAAALAGLVGALAELIPVANLDDNFTLPVLSAVGLWAIYLLFGYPVTIGAMF